MEQTYEKYSTTLALMDACVATKDLPRTGWSDGTHPCHATWDACFDFVFANFAKPQTANSDNELNFRFTTGHPEFDLVRPLFNGTYKGDEFERMLRSIPPKFSEEIFPVAVFRYLISDLMLPLNHLHLNGFSEYHKLYSPMHLYC